MKKIMAMFLAASMTLGMSVTAFASDYLRPNGDKASDSDGVFLEEMDEYDEKDKVIELEPGETYEFDLVNRNGSSVECVSNSDLRDYDKKDDDVFYVKASVKEGKSYVSSVDIDDDDSELVIKTKSNVSRDKNFTVEIKAKNTDGKYKYSYYEFVVVGEDSSTNSEKEEIDDDEWDLDLDERYSLKFDRDLARCKLNFEDEVYVAMRFGSTTKYTMECDTTDNKRVISDAPNDAELRFYRFPNKNRLEYKATVGIEIDNDEKYVYEIDSNNKLTDLHATKKNDYLTFTTDKLGAYVISDTKLSTSGSSNHENNNTSKPSGGSSTTATENVTYNTLKNALDSVSYNGTATVYITDDSYLKVSDLKSAFQGNTGKQIKFVCKNGSSVKYQYYMNYRQVAAMTGTNYNLGLDMGATSTKNLFNRYFKNKVVVVGSNAAINGSKAVFAAKANLSSLNTNNLKVYIYDRNKNHFELVANPYLAVDRNGYVHYTVPVGYDVIFTDSYMTSK